MARLLLVTVVGLVPVSRAAHIDLGHGFKSSIEWIPRDPVVTYPTAAELVREQVLPEFFSWTNVDGVSYATPDQNQHIPVYCGACWIHGTLSMLNDRIKVLRRGVFPDVVLGRQGLINCVPDYTNSSAPPPGCNGGDPWMIFKYMREHPMPDETCLPYQARNMGCSAMNVCQNCAPPQLVATGKIPNVTCFPITNYIGYSVGDHGNVSGEVAMMKEIFARGPIVCQMVADAEFVLNYTLIAGQSEGIYTIDRNYTEGDIDHNVEVTGWGVSESGMPYWQVRNSWGTYWGDNGWFKVRRGANQNKIESSCDWALPNWDTLDTELHYEVLGSYFSGVKLQIGSLGGSNNTPSATEVMPAEEMDQSQHEQHEQQQQQPVALVVLALALGSVAGAAVTLAVVRRPVTGEKYTPLLASA